MTQQSSRHDSDVHQHLGDGAQQGGSRSSHVIPNTRGSHHILPSQVAYEGSTTTRLPQGSRQGITTHTQSEESARQRKVIKNRPDATASLNHNK
jgi:hypothetical protein